MKRYVIHYKQEFMGKILEDSFKTTVNNEDDLDSVIQGLYFDADVIGYWYEEAPMYKQY